MSDDRDHRSAPPPAKEKDGAAPAAGVPKGPPSRGMEALLRSLFSGEDKGEGDAPEPGAPKRRLDDLEEPSDESLAAESLAGLLDDDDLLDDDLDEDELAALMPPKAGGDRGLLGPPAEGAGDASATRDTSGGGDPEDSAPDAGGPNASAPNASAAANLLKALFGGGGDSLGPGDEPAEDASEDGEEDDPAGALALLTWMVEHQQLELEPGADLKALAHDFTPVLAPLLGQKDSAEEAADWLADRSEVAELFISDEHLQALMDQW